MVETPAGPPSRRLHSARVRRKAALREGIYLVALLASAGGLYALLVLLPGRLRTDELRCQRELLTREVSHLEEGIGRLDAETKALHGDRWVVERALRRKLGYLRPGERVLALGLPRD